MSTVGEVYIYSTKGKVQGNFSFLDDEPNCVFGSDLTCDVRIQRVNVSEKHASLSMDDDKQVSPPFFSLNSCKYLKLNHCPKHYIT